MYVGVTDTYKKSCAIAEEHSLLALEAAHIKPYGEIGPQAVHNGVSPQSDARQLFNKGSITVTPDLRIEAGPRLSEDFENGRYDYPLDGANSSTCLQMPPTDLQKSFSYDTIKISEAKRFLNR